MLLVVAAVALMMASVIVLMWCTGRGLGEDDWEAGADWESVEPILRACDHSPFGLPASQ